MTDEKSTISTVAETITSAATTSGSEIIGAATDYQWKVKQWFTALSPEERAAALGFMDGPWTALWTQVVTASALSSSSHNQSESPKIPSDVSHLEKRASEGMPTEVAGPPRSDEKTSSVAANGN